MKYILIIIAVLVFSVSCVSGYGAGSLRAEIQEQTERIEYLEKKLEENQVFFRGYTAEEWAQAARAYYQGCEKLKQAVAFWYNKYLELGGEPAE